MVLLMKLPNDIPVFGDTKFRGDCPSESLEQVTFFSRLRRQYPDSWGAIAVHIRNEGIRHRFQAAKEKSEGMVTGAPDIIIPGARTFICELKRRDHTKSTIGKEQLVYLRAASLAGAFVCIALGSDAAEEAFVECLGGT